MCTVGRLDGRPTSPASCSGGWWVSCCRPSCACCNGSAEAVRAEQAASDERRRIAREVHDVIAHSLSITLLHLTGARRALQEDRDVDEAIEALTDAERLGRQAMADIRQTVGLLDAGPSRVAPEPDIADIPELVADFVRAGVHVKYDLTGSPEAVSAATGLGLYRITQESLANVVKHAPGETAKVRLRVADDAVVVSIVNGTHRAPRSEPGAGSGLRGMRQRAELLGGSLVAGPDANGMVGARRVPARDRDSATACSRAGSPGSRDRDGRQGAPGRRPGIGALGTATDPAAQGRLHHRGRVRRWLRGARRGGAPLPRRRGDGSADEAGRRDRGDEAAAIDRSTAARAGADHLRRRSSALRRVARGCRRLHPQGFARRGTHSRHSDHRRGRCLPRPGGHRAGPRHLPHVRAGPRRQHRPSTI